MDTIIVDTPDESAEENNAVTAQVIEETTEHAFDIGVLSAVVAAQRDRLDSIETRLEVIENRAQWATEDAERAITIASDAVDTAVEIAREAVAAIEEIVEESQTEDETEIVEVEEIPEDIPPGKTHWLKRPAREWFGR